MWLRLIKMKAWIAKPLWKRYPYVVSQRPSILLAYIIGLSIIFTLIVTAKMDSLQDIGEEIFPKISIPYLEESMKIIGGTFVGGLLAILITNSWQQRSIGLEMLKELNSPEFLAVRNALSTQMRISRTSKIELENLHGWFPAGLPYGGDREIIMDSDEAFTRKHALASMVYFVVRMSNYARNGMLNVYMTQHLFAAFFVHYKDVLLEFAEAMDLYYTKFYKDGPTITVEEKKNGMWLRRTEDIRYFFEILALSGKLRTGYQYQYFLSVVAGKIPNENDECASNVDLDQFRKRNF